MLDANKPIINKAIFLGSKSLGISVFKTLFNATKDLNWTIIHPNDVDDPRSRLNEWESLARSLKIDFYVSSSKVVTKQIIVQIKPDIGFVCGWYSLLDKETLSLVNNGFWGIHNSLLPKYRGGAPLVWSIMNGDLVVGSTVFKITEEMDAGEVLLQVSVDNTINDTIGTILTKIEESLLNALPQKWEMLTLGVATLSTQHEPDATYCGQRIEADGCIDWTKNSLDIHNFIRAQSFPYPCAFTYYKESKIYLELSDIVEGTFYGTPGQLLKRNSESVLIACGENTAILVVTISVNGTSCAAASYLTSHKVRLTTQPFR